CACRIGTTMDLGIRGRHALVFGGSKGMGRACAHQLASEGVNVTIAARTESTLAKAADEITAATGTRVRYVVADITTDEGRGAALTACATPDILVNNADGAPPGDFRQWTQADWHSALDSMALGPTDTIRPDREGLERKNRG